MQVAPVDARFAEVGGPRPNLVAPGPAPAAQVLRARSLSLWRVSKSCSERSACASAATASRIALSSERVERRSASARRRRPRAT